MKSIEFHIFIISLIVLTFIVLWGCKQKEEEPLWDYDQTVEIITDAQLIEAELIIQKNHPKKDSISAVYYHHLFEKYQTNQVEFDSVLKYYSQHPVKMDSLYADVITRLTLIQSQHQVEQK